MLRSSRIAVITSASIATSSASCRKEEEELDDEEEKYRVSTGTWVGWATRQLGLALASTVSMPRHVAFILDGNRRFAVKRGVSNGHLSGFEKLHEALEWCYDLGISNVTVFAFSIENFKRSKKEVDLLMNLAMEKIKVLLGKSHLMKKNQVVVRVWGNVSLLPSELQVLVQEITSRTKNNTGPRMNICFPYTSTDEMVTATRRVAQAALDGKVKLEDISTDFFEKNMFSAQDHPDLLIRTSGETRLSDFLVWQTGYCPFLVFDCLWPEFSAFHLYSAVLRYNVWKAQQNLGL